MADADMSRLSVGGATARGTVARLRMTGARDARLAKHGSSANDRGSHPVKV